MARVFLGIGSNEGDRLANISRAVGYLAAIPGIRVSKIAPIYETQPIGGPPQGDFLNTVVELQTSLLPLQLLGEAKNVEQQFGRLPTGPRWGPRLIDLDILLYGDQVIQEPTLVIPHSRMHVRRFVLEPLAQLAPEFVHPVLGRTVAELLRLLPEGGQTEPVAAG